MKRLIGAAAPLAAMAVVARGHFVFIVPPAKDGDKVKVVFSDSTKPDAPKYLKKIEGTKFHVVNEKGDAEEVKAKTGEDALEIAAPSKGATCVVGTTSYGVIEKKGEAFALTYYSRAALTEAGREQKLPAKVAPLQALVTEVKGSVTVLVLWQGEPLAGAEVALVGAEGTEKTGKDGTTKITLPKEKESLIAVRARHVDEKAGEQDGKKYASARYYSTTVFKHP